MKIYYNEQFVRESMMPLLAEIFTDMAAPWGQEAKGAYLKKLLIPSPLTAAEKEHFRWDYFAPKRVVEKRPFTGITDQDAHQRELFLKLLSDMLKTRIQLLGRHNIQERLLPSEDRTYETNIELRNMLYRLAYRFMHHFEQDQLQMMLPSATLDDHARQKQEAKIQSGEMKILQLDINGETQEFVIQDNELELLKKELPQDPATVETIKNLEKEFRITKQVAIEEVLEDHGLEIVEGAVVWNDGTATATVQDVSGQLLTVTINLQAPDDDAHKYTFTFKGKAADNMPDRTGTSFHISQNDLKKLFIDEHGKPRTAEDVLKAKFGFKPFIDHPDQATPQEKLPPHPITTTHLPLEKKKSEPEMVMSSKIPFTHPDIAMSKKAKFTDQQQTVQFQKQQQMFAQQKKASALRTQVPAKTATPATMHKPDLFHVTANKMRLQQQKQLQRAALVQQKNAAMQQIKARAAQKQKMSAGAKLAIGAGVVSGGTFGTTLWMAFQAASKSGAAANATLEIAHWCWQLVCMA